MVTPQAPPGFAVRTEAQKAAFDTAFRLERGVETGWLRYGSTTRGDIWIAGASTASGEYRTARLVLDTWGWIERGELT